MSRITNAVAQKIAEKLTEIKKNEIAKIEETINGIAYEIHYNSIPELVLKAFKDNPNYFNSHSSMNLFGPGLDHQSVKLRQRLPGKNYLISVGERDAGQLVKLFNKVADKKKNLKGLKEAIIISLINLRTFKNIEANFPEAFALLPPPNTTTALAIDLSALRNQLV